MTKAQIGPNSLTLNQSSLNNVREDLSLTREKRCNLVIYIHLQTSRSFTNHPSRDGSKKQHKCITTSSGE